MANLAQLVVKEVHGAGGYGMLVGPTASKAEIENFAKRLKAQPDNYIAQPTRWPWQKFMPRCKLLWSR
jgi:uncharacterized circularly permuted ATP-grasp superfamily protein